MYNHNKAQQSSNRVHISWDILYVIQSISELVWTLKCELWIYLAQIHNQVSAIWFLYVDLNTNSVLLIL